MQNRHIDRQSYFRELSNTSRTFFLPYVKTYHDVSPNCRVLEIGCGEGGNLLPFAEQKCFVEGIDYSVTRISQAKVFFQKSGAKGLFINENVFSFNLLDPNEKFDIIMIHDVVEHIFEKKKLMEHLKDFIKPNGIIFWGFPAWQMPFGGHQQICHSKICSKLPFIHLLPMPLYQLLLKFFGEDKNCIKELVNIKKTRVTIEDFEKLSKESNYNILDRCLWLVNPHYLQKFHLKPRKLSHFLSRIKYFRNFFSTSCFYITQCKES